jgi:hypothetical protein
MAKSTWTPNETQKAFMAELASRPEGATIFELKLEGKDFKTGSINTLITKGLVVNVETKYYECEVVYNGTVVGKVSKPSAVYKLVGRD